MKSPALLRTSTALILCMLLALPALPQTGGHIGPSTGEVVGIIVGVAAAITVVGILIYRESHKPSLHYGMRCLRRRRPNPAERKRQESLRPIWRLRCSSSWRTIHAYRQEEQRL